MASAADATLPTDARRSRRRQLLVIVGMFLSLGGFVLLGYSLPLDPGALLRAAAFVGAGALFVWIGGILMGTAYGQKARGRRRER
ncbi:MAG: hypothetical protein L3K23_00180 [Thermoplasmata archaeon]|nr:hypothetical protein [Thermoplasmata archaeon]